MSVSFANSTVDTIKSRVNIVDVIGQVVQLKRAGSNYKGVCPFHNEKTPSFVVSEEKQIFTCFGCGESGDVISFVEKYYNLEFKEAVTKIAKAYNIPVDMKSGPGEDRYKEYYEANRIAAAFFYRAFTGQANPAIEYMLNRGISRRLLKRYGIGYADSKWQSLYGYMKEKGFSDDLLLKLGLVSQKNGRFYDKFRNRVMFPIIDTKGRVIGFGGRTLEKDGIPKYLNSPENPVFKKKNNLYGLNLAKDTVRKERKIIVVEGYMDVISLAQAGIDNTVASLGTALTENQATLMRRYTENAVLSYDSDSAGRNAALRGIEILKGADCKVKVLHVTDGKDPDDFIKKNGRDAFLQLVEAAQPYGKYRIESVKRRYDLSRQEQRILCLKELAAVIKSFSPIEQDIYIKDVASDMQVSQVALQKEISRVKPEHNQDVRFEKRQEKKQPRQRIAMPQTEKELISLAIRDQDYVTGVAKLAAQFRSSMARRIFNGVTDEFLQEGPFNRNRFMENLDEDQRKIVDDILREVPEGGDPDEILSDCVYRMELERLEEEADMVTEFIAQNEQEEAGEGELVEQAVRRLMEIQKQIQKKKSHRG